MQNIYITEYYSAMTKENVFPFETTVMDHEHIMLREITQEQKYKSCMLSLIVKEVKYEKNKNKSKKTRVRWSLPGDTGREIRELVVKDTNL